MKRSFQDVLILCTQSVTSALRGESHRSYDLSTPASWEGDLPRRPRILVHCENGDAALVPLLEHLQRDGLPVHLATATPPSFCKHEAFSSIRSRGVLSLTRSVTVLDGERLLLRLPETATIQQFFDAQERMLASLVIDLVHIQSDAPKLRKAFAGTFLWDRTQISPLPAWRHLAAAVRRHDGQFPSFAIIYSSDPPARIQHLLKRLGKHGILGAAFPKRSGTRVGAFFPIDLARDFPLA